MTADQYRSALAALSLGHRQAARILDISPRASRRWAALELGQFNGEYVRNTLADWEFLDACRTTIFNRVTNRTILVNGEALTDSQPSVI